MPIVAALYITINRVDALRGINSAAVVVAIALYLTTQSLTLVYASRKFPEALPKLRPALELQTEEFEAISRDARDRFFRPSLKLLAVLLLLSFTGTYSVVQSELYQGDLVLTILLAVALAYVSGLNWVGIWSLYSFLRVSSSLGKNIRVRVNPFHPDRVGGLAPVADLSTLAMFLVSIYTAFSVPIWYFVSPFNALGLTIVTSIIIPVFFFYSMTGIYFALRTEKRKILTEMADELLAAGNQLRKYLSANHSNVSSVDELVRDSSAIEAMQSIYVSVSGMRTFPINNEMLLKLASTMLSPVAALVATQAFIALGRYLGVWL